MRPGVALGHPNVMAAATQDEIERINETCRSARQTPNPRRRAQPLHHDRYSCHRARGVNASEKRSGPSFSIFARQSHIWD